MQERAHLFVTRGRSSGNSRLTRPQQRWAQATVVHAHKPTHKPGLVCPAELPTPSSRLTTVPPRDKASDQEPVASLSLGSYEVGAFLTN